MEEEGYKKLLKKMFKSKLGVPRLERDKYESNDVAELLQA
jgi:hypothetical protein